MAATPQSSNNRIWLLVLAIVGIFIAIAAIIFLIRYQKPERIIINPPAPTGTPASIRVYVSGAVLQPEVYTLPPESIVSDALTAAGGTLPDADLNRINLAKGLSDGEQVYVSLIGEAPTPAPVNVDGAPVVGPVNINTADQTQLETLPGIGPATAQSIIAYREENGDFQTIEDIQNVSGIGPATLENLKDLITVDP